MTDTITIPLTKGYSTVIDAVDADLAKERWCVQESIKGGVVYAKATRRYGKRHIPMHRVVMARMINRPLHSKELVDHINGNPLDNRRGNLRIASAGESQMNRAPRADNTTGVSGVHWSAESQKWRVRLKLQGHNLHLGLFADFDEAVAARRAAEIEYYGEFSPLLSRQEPS